MATLRAIRGPDAAMERAFARGLPDKASHFRFVGALRELTPQMLPHFTEVDPSRETAFVVVTPHAGAELEIAVGRYVLNADGESCEFAAVVADDWQHQGIGDRLVQALAEHAGARGLRRMEGSVLATNTRMLRLARRLGFEVRATPDEPTLRVLARTLQAPTAPAAARPERSVRT